MHRRMVVKVVSNRSIKHRSKIKGERGVTPHLVLIAPGPIRIHIHQRLIHLQILSLMLLQNLIHPVMDDVGRRGN